MNSYRESDFAYLGISEEILDGIFAAEDCGEASREDIDYDSSDCDCDWTSYTGYGGGASTDGKSYLKIDIQENSSRQVEVQDNLQADRDNSIFHHVVQGCLPYATPGFSFLCIIIISIIDIGYSIWEGEF